nr:PREDICTED: F-box protein CPR30-like [Daucus carota subsp. sativus]XP_017251620.1 PREDICTED: F-box protein CPR30-like [Daucus carota subsp. sativus]
MITEILVRLPVKSVLICKSVCKPWLSTISNPYFVKYQLQRAMNNPNTLLIIKDYALGDEKEGTLTTLDMFPVQINSLVMPSMFSAYPLVGSCNGIVCVENISNSIYLWNPSIRQYKRIAGPFRFELQYKLGFGFDSISNDYKVICIMYKTWTEVKVPEVFVYSANADSWRNFEDPVLENLKIYWGYHVVVKGVVYFYNVNEFISFDLHKEVFGLVPFLDPINKRCLGSWILKVLLLCSFSLMVMDVNMIYGRWMMLLTRCLGPRNAALI